MSFASQMENGTMRFFCSIGQQVSSVEKCFGSWFSDTLCYYPSFIEVQNAHFGLTSCSDGGSCCLDSKTCFDEVQTLDPEYYQSIVDSCNGNRACQDLTAQQARPPKCSSQATDFVEIFYQCVTSKCSSSLHMNQNISSCDQQTDQAFLPHLGSQNKNVLVAFCNFLFPQVWSQNPNATMRNSRRRCVHTHLWLKSSTLNSAQPDTAMTCVAWSVRTAPWMWQMFHPSTTKKYWIPATADTPVAILVWNAVHCGTAATQCPPTLRYSTNVWQVCWTAGDTAVLKENFLSIWRSNRKMCVSVLWQWLLGRLWNLHKPTRSPPKCARQNYIIAV